MCILSRNAIKKLPLFADGGKVWSYMKLIELLEHYPYQEYYVAIFRWVEGGCLFDYWNFEKYDKNPDIISPAVRFKELPARQKLSAVEDIFSFLETAAANHYVAVDFLRRKPDL